MVFVLAAMSLWASPLVLEGRVGNVGGSPEGRVVLHVANEVKVLAGPWVKQLKHVGDAQVEITGAVSENGEVQVHHFRLLDVGCGMKPVVGQLVVKNMQLSLQDGEAAPIVLHAGPKVRMNILDRVGKGGRFWVCGPVLLSGGLQVKRFGVLEPQKK
jgi:hypothetical protein